MEGSYAESRAKKKVTTKDTLIKFGLIAGMIVFFGLGLLTRSMLQMVVGIVFMIAGYFILPRLETEYEYVFCDGQVDFDKISGGAKRKTMMRVDFEKLVVIAPKNSHALDGYRHNGVAVKDFTSMDANAKFKFGCFGSGSVNVSGKVSSSRENTRSTNQTAKYQVHVSARQQRQTEGLSKLMDIMASCVEPLPNPNPSTGK